MASEGADGHRDRSTTQPMIDESARLEAAAIEARSRGDFESAGRDFAAASQSASDEQRRLNLLIRQACCLLSVERSAEAAAIATRVAEQSRAGAHWVELADALGLIVDDHLRTGRFAEAAHQLSEAVDLLDKLPATPAAYPVVHNLAATHEHSGFFDEAITLFKRALSLAGNDEDRRFTHASMASTYHFAAARSAGPDERRGLLEAGLDAAALVESYPTELRTTCSALAHGAMMLARIGRYEEAIGRAAKVRAMAAEHGLVEDDMYATAAHAIALWRTRRDPQVLDYVAQTLETARRLQLLDNLSVLQDVEVEILWALGRYDDARQRQQGHLDALRGRLAAERRVRWAHVRLGVDHRRMEALSTSDPLTGLPNRRYLDRLMARIAASEAPVYVGLADLDGFKAVNDQLSYAAGDSVIREFASLLERSCRPGDTVVRLGGDEFVLVLWGLGPANAPAAFERIRSAVARHRFDGVPASFALSASIGVTASQLGLSSGQSTLLAQATVALHDAKRTGRNKVVFSLGAAD